MTKFKRKIFFYLLVSIFIIIAPIILLHTSGYRYNWNKYKIELTGIINIVTSPIEAEVYLNGIKHSQLTPTSIFRLLPEEYELEIKKTNYLPWKKRLIVESGKTTFAKNVYLLPNNLPKLISQSDINQNVFGYNGTEIAYLINDDQWTELFYYNLQTNKNILLARFGNESFQEIKLSISPNGKKVLMRGINSKTNTETISLFSTSITESSIDVVDSPYPNKITTRWSIDGRKLLVGNEKHLFEIDEAGIKNPIVSETNLDGLIYDFIEGADNRIWLLISNGSDLKLSYLHNTDRTEHTDYLNLPYKKINFINATPTDLWLSDNTNGLKISINDNKIVELPAFKNIVYENNNQRGRLLFWNDFEIFIAESDGSNPEVITRISTLINDCIWHPKGSHIIFSTDSEIIAMEIDGRDRRNAYKLVDFGTVGSMGINAESLLLYFIGAIGNQRGIYEKAI